MPSPGRRGPGPGDGNLIDRTPQNLPVQLGGFAATHQNRRASPLIKWWRRNSATLVALLGLVAAVAGGLLATAGAATPVYIKSGQVHIGNQVLTPEPQAGVPGNFYGGPAALDIITVGQDEVVAAASTESNGSDVQGYCLMTQKALGDLTESCTFTVGDQSFTAKDTLISSQGSVWHRRYSDGVTTEISIPTDGAVIPVPFPVGR